MLETNRERLRVGQASRTARIRFRARISSAVTDGAGPGLARRAQPTAHRL